MTRSDPKTELVDDLLEFTGRPDRVTDRGRKAIELAVLAACEFASPVIDSRHLLCGLMREEQGVAFHIVNEMGLKRQTLEQGLTALPNSGKVIPPTIGDVSLLMHRCSAIASSMDHDYIGTEHLLLGIVESETRAKHLLAELGIDGDSLSSKIRTLICGPIHGGMSKLHYPMSLFKYVFRDLNDAAHLRISVSESTINRLLQFSGDPLQHATDGFTPQEKLLLRQDHRRIFYLLLRIVLPTEAGNAIDDVERAEKLKEAHVEKHEFEEAARWLHERDSAFLALSKYVNDASTVLPAHVERLFEQLAASESGDKNSG